MVGLLVFSCFKLADDAAETPSILHPRLKKVDRDFLSRGPAQRAAAEQVDVEVEDGLSGARADVEDGAVSLLDIALASDLGGGQVTAADDFGIGGLGFL
jgi:hypothetical protein